MPAAIFNLAMQGSEDAIFLLTASSDVDPMRCGGTSFITLQVRYAGQGAGDVNGNGTLDICENSCPGDGDASGEVNTVDMLGLFAVWGTSDPNYDIAPVGGDGIVNTQDLLALFSFWGSCP